MSFSESELALEANQVHLALLDFDKVRGCISLATLDDTTAKMRQVAIAPEDQSKGIGSYLCYLSEKFAIESLGAKKIILHARETARNFYLRQGYRPVGDTFFEVGEAHIKMEKDLEPFTQPLAEYLTPDDVSRRENLAILPIGAIEWHGEHLPLGTDNTLAMRFAEWLGARTGGVVYPVLWTAMTTLPHSMSIKVSPETLRSVVRETLESLVGAGFTKIFVVTGHYAQGHEWVLYELAEKLMEENPGVRILAATPLEVLGNDDLLDHAGRVEALQHPWQDTRCNKLPAKLNPSEHAVLGADPRTSLPAEGDWLPNAIKKWEEWKVLLDGPEGDSRLRTFYKDRRNAIQGYVDSFYRGDWDEAIVTWWQTKA